MSLTRVTPLDGEAARVAILKAAQRLPIRAYRTADLLAEVAESENAKRKRRPRKADT